MNLALFDLDNTLLAGDSDYAWAQFLIREGVLERAAFEARNEAYYAQYKAGTLDIFDYLAFQSGPLVGRSATELRGWHARYMAQTVEPMILPKARELLTAHRADLCAIVTATNDFITAPIAEALGVEHLIASELERGPDGYTGRGAGTPAFQSGKITRVKQWLAGLGRDLSSFDQSHFYSDSHNDIPLLEAVTHPVAVDPDPTLRAHALARGWTVLSLR
ncbi:MAG: HAD family hydrolase [Betaproteobacteria bacterium]|nr:HAD family hydrolase [Betaproteobacteria bacterium]